MLFWFLIVSIIVWAVIRTTVVLFIMFMMGRDQSEYFDDDDQF
jgi:uncharacterized membrane protein